MQPVFRFWAGVDLAVTALMAFPPIASFIVEVIFHLSDREVPPAFSSEGLFFVCLAGALGVLWALARLTDPRRLLVQLDVIGRVWVTALIGWFVIGVGAPVALLAFTLSEVLGALHQAWALTRQTDHRSDSA